MTAIAVSDARAIAGVTCEESDVGAESEADEAESTSSCSASSGADADAERSMLSSTMTLLILSEMAAFVLGSGKTTGVTRVEFDAWLPPLNSGSWIVVVASSVAAKATSMGSTISDPVTATTRARSAVPVMKRTMVQFS